MVTAPPDTCRYIAWNPPFCAPQILGSLMSPVWLPSLSIWAEDQAELWPRDACALHQSARPIWTKGCIDLCVLQKITSEHYSFALPLALLVDSGRSRAISRLSEEKYFRAASRTLFALRALARSGSFSMPGKA